MITTAGSYADIDSTTYGINNQSVLNSIPNFHVANGQMPQDIMHILFEGVVPFEIKLMLQFSFMRTTILI